MMLRVRCECGKVLKLTDRSVGQAIPCPTCGRRIRIAPRDDASIESLEEVESPLPASPVVEELYPIAEPDRRAPTGPVMLPPMSADRGLDGPPCPACDGLLPAGARICIHCGIDLATGRPVAEPQARIEKAIRAASTLLPLGIFPFTPLDPVRQRGTLATWVIATTTLLASVVFFAAMRFGDDPESPILHLQLWTGSRAAFQERQARLVDLMERRVRQQTAAADNPRETRRRATTMAAAVTGVPENARFRFFQLLSSSFLHDSSGLFAFLYHLACNLLFLLIFGLAVNETIGSGRMLATYALLALIAAAAEALLNLREPLHPSVGASGAISGLAGIYAVLFGWRHAALVAWMRLPARLEHTRYPIRAAWLIVAWLCLNNLLPAIAEVRTEDAHIPHAGTGIAFVAGGLIAVGMRVCGWVNEPSRTKYSSAIRSD